MAKQKTIEVPWDVFEALVDTVRDAHPNYTDLGMATEGYQNIVLWSGPGNHGIALIITPQREDQEDEDPSDGGTAEAAAGVADESIEASIARLREAWNTAPSHPA